MQRWDIGCFRHSYGVDVKFECDYCHPISVHLFPNENLMQMTKSKIQIQIYITVGSCMASYRCTLAWTVRIISHHWRLVQRFQQVLPNLWISNIKTHDWFYEWNSGVFVFQNYDHQNSQVRVAQILLSYVGSNLDKIVALLLILVEYKIPTR